jgi:hypothetical protein
MQSLELTCACVSACMLGECVRCSQFSRVEINVSAVEPNQRFLIMNMISPKKMVSSCSWVVTGVVGRTRPRFHIYGPAVLTAEKMEQTGSEGRIHCSPEAEAAYSASEFGFLPAVSPRIPVPSVDCTSPTARVTLECSVPMAPLPLDEHSQISGVAIVQDLKTRTVEVPRSISTSADDSLSPGAHEQTGSFRRRLVSAAESDSSERRDDIRQHLLAGSEDSMSSNSVGCSATVMARVTSSRSLRAAPPPSLVPGVNVATGTEMQFPLEAISSSSGVTNSVFPELSEQAPTVAVAAPSVTAQTLSDSPWLMRSSAAVADAVFVPPSSDDFRSLSTTRARVVQERAGSSARQLGNDFEVAASFG